VQLAGLAVDRLHPADGIGSQLGVRRAGRKKLGEASAAGLLEPFDRVRVRGREVERAGPSVLEVQERVPAAEVGERVDPLPLRRFDVGEPASVVRFGHQSPLPWRPAAARGRRA
jgi:hypothetical protein